MDSELRMTAQNKADMERRKRLEDWKVKNLDSKPYWVIQHADGSILYQSTDPDVDMPLIDVLMQTGYDVDKDGHLGQLMFGA